MNKSAEQRMCEDATGCVQTGKMVYYDEDGNKVTQEQAAELLKNSKLVEIPSAGAGNYSGIFTSLGFEEVEVIDWTSSAGDWTFGVKNEDGWFMAFQENRYPYYGFKYSVSQGYGGFATFEDLCKEIEYL